MNRKLFGTDGVRGKANTLFTEYIEGSVYFETLVLTDASGSAIASNNTDATGNLDVTATTYFKNALAGEVGISKVQKSPVSGRPVVVISNPVIMNKKIEGVLLSFVDIMNLGTKYIKPLKIGQTGFGYLIGEDGSVLYHPDVKKILMGEESESSKETRI